MVSGFAHSLYVVILMFYVYHIYIMNDQENSNQFGYMLFVGVLYPMTYDFTQLYRAGPRAYFSEAQNYSD